MYNQVAVSIFYVFYILAEIPSSLLAKRLQFNRVIAAVAFSWGLVCLGNGFVQNFAGLAVCGALIGALRGLSLSKYGPDDGRLVSTRRVWIPSWMGLQ
jgi:hypothetical protein